MRQSIHTKRTRIDFVIILIFSILFCIHSIRTIYRLNSFNIELSLLIFMMVLFLISAVAAFKMIEELSESIETTDDELILYVFSHKDKSIAWNEIAEIGIGQIYYPTGCQYCVYFSKEPLTYAEVDNLDLADYKCIYLRTLTKENYDRICKYCSEEDMQIIKNWIS